MSARHSERSEHQRRRRQKHRKGQPKGPEPRKLDQETQLVGDAMSSECERCGEPAFRDGLVVWRSCTTCGTRFPFAQFQIIMLIMGGIFGVGSVAAVMGKLEQADIIWFFPMILARIFLLLCL